MDAGEKVSEAVAGQLAAKYPRLAREAAGATAGNLVVTTSSGIADRAPVGAVLSRHREFLMPGGSVVVLDEPEEVAAAPVAVVCPSAREIELEFEIAGLKAEIAAARSTPPVVEEKPIASEVQGDNGSDTQV